MRAGGGTNAALRRSFGIAKVLAWRVRLCLGAVRAAGGRGLRFPWHPVPRLWPASGHLCARSRCAWAGGGTNTALWLSFGAPKVLVRRACLCLGVARAAGGRGLRFL